MKQTNKVNKKAKAEQEAKRQATIQEAKERNKEISNEEIELIEVTGISRQGFGISGRYRIVLSNKTVSTIKDILRTLRSEI